MFCESCGTVLNADRQCVNCEKKQLKENVEGQESLVAKLVGWGEMMKDDPRFCPVCDKLLLKKDPSGFVLVIRCDQCYKLIHERCYMNHHLIHHELIGVITEIEEPKIGTFIKEKS